MIRCDCAIALRVHSTLAVKAIQELARVRPRIAKRLLAEANAHAKRLRKHCDMGNHGPWAKA